MRKQKSTDAEQAQRAAAEYKPEDCATARKLCELGATTADLADFFGVPTSMIFSWQMSHREFFDACKVGNDLANERVERAVYERACGHTRVVTKLVQCRGKPRIVKYEEHVPGDMDAAKFCLVNDRKGRWVAKPGDAIRVNEELKKQAHQEWFKQFEGTALRPGGWKGPKSENPDGNQNQ